MTRATTLNRAGWRKEVGATACGTWLRAEGGRTVRRGPNPDKVHGAPVEGEARAFHYFNSHEPEPRDDKTIMKYIPGQDWRQKREIIRRLAANIKARGEAQSFTPVPLSEADKELVEDVTRFEQYRGSILKQHGKRPVVTNR
jgi:hypothetical protein